MKRQINNLLFLYGFMIALAVGRMNYIQFGQSLLTKINSTLSKPHREGKVIAEQTTSKALQNKAFIVMPKQFIGSAYLNKAYIAQRVGVPTGHYQNWSKAPTTNYGRDGP